MLRQTIINTYLAVGQTAFECGEHELCERMFAAALAETRNESQTQLADTQLAEQLVVIAASYARQERFVKAESLLKRALILYSNALGQAALPCALVLIKMAELSTVQHKLAQAAQLLKRALVACQRCGEQDQARAISRRLAFLYLKLGRIEEAHHVWFDEHAPVLQPARRSQTN